jgi:hypothetical protein
MQIPSCLEADPIHVPDAPPAVRTFCVVWRRNSGELWKADVTADDVTAAVRAVCYDQHTNPEDIIGVIDRTTIR